MKKNMNHLRGLSLILALGILMAETVSATAQNSIEIKGKIQFTAPDFEMTVYRYDGSEMLTLATAPVQQDGSYALRVPVTQPGVLTLRCSVWQEVNFWAEDEDLRIDFRGLDTARVKIKNPPYVHIYGGKNNEVMNLINFAAYRNYQMMIAISRATYQAQIADADAQKELSSNLYDASNDQFHAWLRHIVEYYADRKAVMVAVNSLNPETDAALIEHTLERLDAAHPGNSLTTAYRENAAREKVLREQMKEGNPAPLFAYPTSDGSKKLGPADYKGKVLLIDFWASWCGPCRQEIPNVKACYEKYKDKGVAVLSVSIDAKEAAWRKAIAEEQMPWDQVLAPEAGKEITSLYQFSGIPFIVLLDREGNIYRKFLRGEAIETAIQDVLDGKPATEPKSSVSVGMGMAM